MVSRGVYGKFLEEIKPGRPETTHTPAKTTSRGGANARASVICDGIITQTERERAAPAASGQKRAHEGRVFGITFMVMT